MTWLQTFTGRAFHTNPPEPDAVHIVDIAHALSNLCRFGGHVRRFYSVAEHSVHVSYLVPPEHALIGLLHDATEAYVVDLPRPIKEQLPTYQDIERRVWHVIAERFGLDPDMPACVKAADNAMLLAERDQLMGPVPIPWTWAAGITPAQRITLCQEPTMARNAFLFRFYEITGQRISMP